LPERTVPLCPRAVRNRKPLRSFRATGITAYLSNGGALEHAQEMAAHESPRMTKLYDGNWNAYCCPSTDLTGRHCRRNSISLARMTSTERSVNA
jgi:hypothetical protein